jgi:hypothetical protein
MKNQIETPGGRVMFIRTPRRLTVEQLNTALGGMDDDDSRWLAVNQMLDEELAGAMLDVSARNNSDRDHDSGRVEALSTLKQRLNDARKAPLVPAAGEGKKR